MHLCNKCTSTLGIILLILGILFLLRDFNVWNFWNIQWWSAAFVILGIAHVAAAGCPMCRKLK